MQFKILIVEDKKNWQEILRDCIRVAFKDNASKARIDVAKDYITARTQIKKTNYHLLLVDPMLPDSSEGIMLLNNIYDLGMRIPAFIISELEYDDILEGAPLYYEVIRFFQKGTLDIRQLQDAMLSILENGRKAFMERNKDRSSSGERYLDFYLFISPDGNIRARSFEGQQKASIRLDLPKDLYEEMNLVEENKTDKESLESFGKKLYELIFPGPIHTHFHQTEAGARTQEKKIRIRLTIDCDELSRLPWEFTYREEGGYFLSTHPKTVLSRYLNLPSPPDWVRKREGRLHLLLIIANPDDQQPLDPDEWEDIVLQALSAPLEENLITVKTVKHATFENIRDALYEQKPDIIQFVGHGIYHNEKGYLALVDTNTNNTWMVDDERFANIFLGHDDHLGLVCLATCESAKSDSPQGFLGIAPKIVEKGVPAVIAMQYKVLISSAEIFLENFYIAVAARKPIDWAVQQARNSVGIKMGLENREFATPVLYMRAKDGIIF